MKNFYFKNFKVNKVEPGCIACKKGAGVKHYVPIKTESGEDGYILISDEEFQKIKEKIEIREVFK